MAGFAIAVLAAVVVVTAFAQNLRHLFGASTSSLVERSSEASPPGDWPTPRGR